MRLESINFNKKRLCRALNDFKANHDLNKDSEESIILGWLRRSLDEMRIRNDSLTGENLVQNQGACQVLQELFDSFETAKDILRTN
jgi:hypothetical protein